VVDGQDVIAVAEAVIASVDRARAGKGPSMIEAKCCRYCSHAIGIPDFKGGELRRQKEIEEMRKRDAILLCRERLLAQGVLTQEDVDRIARSAEEEVAAAEKFADESPIAEPIGLEQLLYAK